MPILLPTTLAAAAAAALINFWLANRIGKLRISEKISVGDGGNELLARRMRAQLNFAENVPFGLILIAALELAAIAALGERLGLERVVGAAHSPAGGRNFSLGDGHRGTCSNAISYRVLRSRLGGSPALHKSAAPWTRAATDGRRAMESALRGRRRAYTDFCARCKAR